MPKMKSHRGAAKRFRVTGTGKLKRKKAGNGHLFEKKSSKRKRDLERCADVSKADASNIRKIMGIGIHK